MSTTTEGIVDHLLGLAEHAKTAGAASERDSVVVWLLHGTKRRHRRIARELANAVWDGEHHAWAAKIRSARPERPSPTEGHVA